MNKENANKENEEPEQIGFEEYSKSNSVFQKYPIQNGIKVRKELPHKIDPNKKENFFKILKQAFNKDISKISMPVSWNEPLTILQRVASILEYKNQITKANREKDKNLQPALILSAYYMNQAIAIGMKKKPFNPLLGETFEIFEEENNLRGLVEQISHHPPISAFHIESDDFIIEGYNQDNISISMKGFRLIPNGEIKVTLKSTGDEFMVKRPETAVTGIMKGNISTWKEGMMKCENLNTGEITTVFFEPLGWFSGKNYETKGKILDKDGGVKYKLIGRWDQYLSIAEETGEQRKIVELSEFPEDRWEQYGFSLFCINANNLTPELAKQLPSSDSRLRPDQRALENGDLKLAISEKHRLEENQRKRRKIRKKDKIAFKPKWFEVEFKKKYIKSCQFNNLYWEFRESGKWPSDHDDIFAN